MNVLLVSADTRVDLDVGDDVRAGGHDHRVQQDPRAEEGVAAGVRDDLGVQRHELAVLGGARLVAHHVRVPLGVREDRLLARVGQAHRPLGPVREQRQVGLHGDVLFAAEPAAEHGGDHPHAVVREPHDVGDVAEVLDDLRGGADGEHAVLVDPGRAGLGLEVHVVAEGHAVLALDDDVGLREAGVDVALAHLVGADDVAVLLADAVGVGLERLERVEHARLRVVDDLDGARGLLGLGERLGGDQRHALAHVAHLLVGQHPVQALEPAAGRVRLAELAGGLVVGHVLGGQHRVDAGHGLGLAGVDGDDLRRRVLAPEHLRGERARASTKSSAYLVWPNTLSRASWRGTARPMTLYWGVSSAPITRSAPRGAPRGTASSMASTILV